MPLDKKTAPKQSNKTGTLPPQRPISTQSLGREDFGVIYINTDGLIHSYNNMLCKLFKFDVNELVDENFFEIFPPSDDAIMSHLKTLIRSKEKIEYHYECYFQKASKTLKPVNIYLLMDEKSGTEQINCIVTRKDRSSDRISQSKAYNQLKDAERIAHLGHWDWDLVDDTLVWSEEMCRIMGYSHSNFSPSYNHLLNAVYEDDRTVLKNNVKKALDGFGDYLVETRIKRPDGSIRYLQTQGETTFSEPGHPIRMFGTSLDITDRKLAEIEVQKLNARLEKRLIERQVILDNISDGILFINNKGELLFINKIAQKIFGIPNRKDIIGKNIDDLNVASEGIQKCLLGLKNTSKRVDFIVGSERYQYLVTGRPIKDGNGQIIGAMEVMTGIEEVTSMVRAVADPFYTAFATIIGQSPKVREVITKAQLISKTDYLVLIQGESGTGKDLFANSIHIESGRKGLFIPINCAALPEQLLESELFGYNRGAFTGAEKNGKPGLFESAQDGTIFLDEIAEMSLPLQAKLLRVIQENKIRRIGGKKEIRINVRVIAATNCNLNEMVQKNQFRQDLFYRINIYPLVIPPLKERKEDIVELSISFLKRVNERLNKSIQSISSRAMEKLMSHDWPGNVRELQNVIERGAIFCEGAKIRLVHIDIGNGAIQNSTSVFDLADWPSREGTMKDVVGQFEKALLEQKLQNYQSIRQAANALGLSHTSIIRKIRKYGIIRNN